jgi:hypothetical protein
MNHSIKNNNFEDWLAGVQRSSRQKKPLKRSIKKRVIMQNKPNSRNAQMNVSPFITVDYENNANYKLCENKANTNPIKPNFKRGTCSLTG